MTFSPVRYIEGEVTDEPIAADRGTPIGHAQVMKVDKGAEGLNSIVSDSNPFPVNLRTSGGAEISPATQAGQTSTIAELSSILAKLNDTLSVLISDAAGNPLTSATSAPAGSERGLHVRQVGAVAATQSGAWSTTAQNLTAEAPNITTGTITANGQSVAAALAGRTGAVIQIYGTYTALNGTFEVSFDGGANYRDTVLATLLNANTIATTTGSISSVVRTYEMSVGGATHVRIRATAFTTGTANIVISASYFASEPIPAIQTHAVTLTSTTLTSVTPGTAATSLGKAVDSVAGATDTGVAALMQRIDTPAAVTPANGDYVVPRLDNFGRQWVNIGAGTVAATQSGTWSAIQVYTAITWGTPVSTAVTTAATVTAANASRKALVIWCHEGEIYYQFGANPSSTVYQGRLGKGQSIMFFEGANTTQSFCALAVGASATVLVTEAT
jgi:hypothetical protein